MRSGMLMLVATCGQSPSPSKMPGSRCGFLTVGSIPLTHELLGADVCQGWLSPELYLRRPPAKNEQYRLDRMLKAAAERGVKVNVIVYKEVSVLFLSLYLCGANDRMQVTQALTRKYLTPTLPDYLHSLFPRSTNVITYTLTRLGH